LEGLLDGVINSVMFGYVDVTGDPEEGYLGYEGVYGSFIPIVFNRKFQTLLEPKQVTDHLCQHILFTKIISRFDRCFGRQNFVRRENPV